MKRADLDKRAQRDKFGPGKHGFQSGTPTAGVLPTIPGAEWFDHVQEEIAGVIEAAGITVNPQQYNQLLTALRKLFAANQAGNTAAAGIVQLSSATDSSAENLAATPKAVKAAYDLAAAKKDNFSNILILDGTAANLGLTATAAANGWIWEVGADGVAKMIQRDKSRFTANAGNVQLFKMPTNKGTNETFAMLSDIQAATGIKSGINLDTHTEHGFFSWSGTTSAAPLPIGGDWAGIVIGYANDCTQIISSAGRLWARGADANPITQASDWSEWSELLNSGNGVMLTGNQTIAGIKTFSGEIKGNSFITLLHRWPKLQLCSSGGDQALLLESGGVAGTHCLIVRPHTDGVASGSNIVKFALPDMTGNQTLATRADLSNVSRRDYSRTVTPPKARTERVQTVGNVTVYPDGRIVQFFHLQHFRVLWFSGGDPSIGYSTNVANGWLVDIPLWTAMPNKVTAVHGQTVRSGNTQSSMAYEFEAAEQTVAWAYNKQGTRKNGVQIDASRIVGTGAEHVDMIITVEGY